MKDKQYPDGKLNSSDVGGLQVEFGVLNERLILTFGKGVCWLGLTKKDTLRFIDVLNGFLPKIK